MTSRDGIWAQPVPAGLTVSGHVGVLTLLDGRPVVERDPNFAAVCFVVHENLTKKTNDKKCMISAIHLSQIKKS